MLLSPWGEDSIPLPDIIDDNESARAIWISIEGFVRVDGEETDRVEIPVATAVTNRGLLFLTQGDKPGEPEEIYPLSYSDVASVDMDGQTMVVTTTENEECRVQYPDKAEIKPILRHLRWIGQLRGHVISLSNDIDLAAGEITDDAYSLDWESARSTYESMRARLDELIVLVHAVEPVKPHNLAPEITDIERTLERAHARLYIERAKSELSLCRHLIENEEYNRTKDKLSDVHEYYERAHQQNESVRRGDAFQFGPQRELRDELETLSWEIETVTAEPLSQAHQAKIEAKSKSDPEEALGHWEQAFERYGQVLRLNSDLDEEHRSGEQAELRDERASAADEIVDIRERLAREAWDSGATHQREGDHKVALKHCLTAVEHLERICELLDSLEMDGKEAIEDRLSQMRQVVAQLREGTEAGATASAATQERTDTSSEQTTDTPPTEEDGTTDSQSFRDDQIPSVSELADIDTHHEITLELDDPTEADGETTDGHDEQTADGDESPQGDKREARK